MPYVPTWREVESRVHYRGLPVPFLAGSLFVVVGSAGFLIMGGAVLPRIPPLYVRLFSGVFVLIGGAAVAVAIRSLCWPTHVHHAAPGVLPQVPQEPLISEGAMVYRPLTHELCRMPERLGTATSESCPAL